MIFVTVGTHTEGFERLVRWMDEIAAELDEEVLIQLGHTSVRPEHAEWFDFKDIEEIIEITQDSELVVGHGGAGTILTTLETGTPIICVPRLEDLGEIYDNHQFELTRKLADKGTIAIANSKKELHQLLTQSPAEIAMEFTADIVPHLEARLAELEEDLT